jgi:hypothetical protein
MKKTALKKNLILKKQTIKALVTTELQHAIGGADQGPTDKQMGCPVITTLVAP